MNENKLIVKSNSLIESRCNLSLNQQKLVLSVIAQIEKDDVDFHEYKMPITEFKRLMDINSTGNYKTIKDMARKIRGKDISLNRGDAEDITGWFYKIRIYHKGVISFFIDPDLKPYLLQLKSHFTSYQLRNILRLKSRYSIRIYELLKQYQKLRERTFDVQELRNLLYIGPDKYPRFDNFKARVLEQSKQEINRETDLVIDYETIKQGRTITSIKFLIALQEQPGQEAKPNTDTQAPEEIPTGCLELIPETSRADCLHLCREILAADGEDGLIFYLKKTNDRKKNGNDNYTGYLKTIFNIHLYAEHVAAEKAIQDRIEVETRKIAKQLQKDQIESQKAQSQQQAMQELRQMEETDPAQYESLRQQAAGTLGINLAKLKRGDDMQIRLEMIEIKKGF